jgi:hypothetical protein
MDDNTPNRTPLWHSHSRDTSCPVPVRIESDFARSMRHIVCYRCLIRNPGALRQLYLQMRKHGSGLENRQDDVLLKPARAL